MTTIKRLKSHNKKEDFYFENRILIKPHNFKINKLHLTFKKSR